MVKCPACGAEVTDPSLGFCTACGAYLSAQGKAPAPEPAVPSDPVEEGAWMASAGRIAEATAAWKKRLYAEPRVSDAVYERMLSSLTEGMLNYPVSAQSFHAAGFADIDMMIRDRELIPDLMKRLSSSLGVCKIQNGVLGLAHPYMFLLIEAFSAYTDIRELRDRIAATRVLEELHELDPLVDLLLGELVHVHEVAQVLLVQVGCAAALESHFSRPFDAQGIILGRGGPCPESLSMLLIRAQTTYRVRWILAGDPACKPRDGRLPLFNTNAICG